CDRGLRRGARFGVLGAGSRRRARPALDRAPETRAHRGRCEPPRTPFRGAGEARLIPIPTSIQRDAMPVYEYLCKGCGHEFEREQRISDAPIKKCPSCGALEARRQISRTSFVLKGGGWYSDLYGSKPAAKTDDAAARTPYTP